MPEDPPFFKVGTGFFTGAGAEDEDDSLAGGGWMTLGSSLALEGGLVDVLAPGC